MADTFSHCMQAVKMDDARSQSMLPGQGCTSMMTSVLQPGCRCQLCRCSASRTQQADVACSPMLPCQLEPCSSNNVLDPQQGLPVRAGLAGQQGHRSALGGGTHQLCSLGGRPDCLDQPCWCQGMPQLD